MTEEELWDRRRDELVRTFRSRTPDDLRWVLGHITGEIAYHDSKTYESPMSYRYLQMARDIATAELASRARARAAA